MRHNLERNPNSKYEYKRNIVHPRTFEEQPLDDKLLSLGGLEPEELVALMEYEVRKWEKHVREKAVVEAVVRKRGEMVGLEELDLAIRMAGSGL